MVLFLATPLPIKTRAAGHRFNVQRPLNKKRKGLREEAFSLECVGILPTNTDPDLAANVLEIGVATDTKIKVHIV